MNNNLAPTSLINILLKQKNSTVHAESQLAALLLSQRKQSPGIGKSLFPKPSETETWMGKFKEGENELV